MTSQTLQTIERHVEIAESERKAHERFREWLLQSEENAVNAIGEVRKNRVVAFYDTLMDSPAHYQLQPNPDRTKVPSYSPYLTEDNKDIALKILNLGGDDFKQHRLNLLYAYIGVDNENSLTRTIGESAKMFEERIKLHGRTPQTQEVYITSTTT